ncbi:Non-essential glycogen phosphorylase [Ascosphaera pollenicola]|nr:Non-essential glycogen phosphorylase [Ascosphaera pollenicola]
MATPPSPVRERRLSVGAPSMDEIQGPVGPGFDRPKHKRTLTGFVASDIKSVEASIPEPQRDAWLKYSVKKFDSKEEFEKETVRHVETSLARSLYNCDEL